MEVMEDTPTPQFPVALCTTAPTIPTAQTGEVGPRTTTRTEGKKKVTFERMELNVTEMSHIYGNN